MTVGLKVLSTEHPNSVGTVLRLNEFGATICWKTPPRESLPYGHANTEFWPAAEHHLLVAVPDEGLAA